MADEHQQASPQQAPQYPYFQATEDGLAEFHREFGRLFHQSLEQRVTTNKLTAAGQRVMATAEAFQAAHGPGTCVPLEQTNGHAETGDPTPLSAGSRPKGG
jgi:hypothetical protein